MMSNVRVYCENITTLCPFSFNLSSNLSNITILPEAVTISSFAPPLLSTSAPGKRYLEWKWKWKWKLKWKWKWKMKNEKWKMKNEKWKIKNEKCKMQNEKWKMKIKNDNDYDNDNYIDNEN